MPLFREILGELKSKKLSRKNAKKRTHKLFNFLQNRIQQCVDRSLHLFFVETFLAFARLFLRNLPFFLLQKVSVVR
jgi:hypothetical protein